LRWAGSASRRTDGAKRKNYSWRGGIEWFNCLVWTSCLLDKIISPVHIIANINNNTSSNNISILRTMGESF
jgi:hypothetical protein